MQSYFVVTLGPFALILYCLFSSQHKYNLDGILSWKDTQVKVVLINNLIGKHVQYEWYKYKKNRCKGEFLV